MPSKIQRNEETAWFCAAWSFFDMLTFVTQIQTDYEQCFAFSLLVTPMARIDVIVVVVFVPNDFLVACHPTPKHTKQKIKCKLFAPCCIYILFAIFVDRIFVKINSMKKNANRENSLCSAPISTQPTQTRTNTPKCWEKKTTQLPFFLQILTIQISIGT